MIYGILPTMMINDDRAVSSLVVLARVHQYSGHKAHVVTNTGDSADIESSAIDINWIRLKFTSG